MSRINIPDQLRERIFRQADGRCGYCLSRQEYVWVNWRSSTPCRGRLMEVMMKIIYGGLVDHATCTRVLKPKRSILPRGCARLFLILERNPGEIILGGAAMAR